MQDDKVTQCPVVGLLVLPTPAGQATEQRDWPLATGTAPSGPCCGKLHGRDLVDKNESASGLRQWTYILSVVAAVTCLQ